MKILQIHNYYQKAGGEDFVFNQERDMLTKHGHKVFQIEAINHDLKRIIAAKKDFYSELEIKIKTTKFDVAHIHNVFHIIGPNIYKYLYEKQIPIIQTIHNFRYFCINGLFLDNKNENCELCIHNNFKYAVKKKCYHNSKLLSYLMRWQVRKVKTQAIHSVQAFIPLNNFAFQIFIEGGFPQNKLIVKHNFLFSKNTKSVSYLPYALYLGRISPEKGLDFFLDAMKNVDFKFVIAGSGTEQQRLENKYSQCHNITFSGFVKGDEKEKLLQEAAFVVMPSLCYENFPISILEAYQNAKAVVAPDFGSFPHNIIHQKTGQLYKQGNVNSLKATVQEMINNEKYKTLGQNAQKHFNDNLTEKQNYQQLINIYQQAIKKNSKTVF